LIPKHEVISKEEVDELLQKYKISKENLPKIYITDPGLEGLEVKAGDVIKITRKSPTAGTAYYYRVVISGHNPKIKESEIIREEEALEWEDEEEEEMEE